MIDRGQFLVLTNDVTLAGTAVTAVTLARPETASPALDNNRDHVIEPQSRDEFRAGKAIVVLPTNIDDAAVQLRRVELVRQSEGFDPNSPTSGGDDQGTNVIGVEAVGPTAGALFPNGSVGAGEPEVLFDDATGITLGTAGAIHDLLANIPIGANQQIRLTFNNTGGAIGPEIISVTYDTGLHAGGYSLQS